MAVWNITILQQICSSADDWNLPKNPSSFLAETKASRGAAFMFDKDWFWGILVFPAFQPPTAQRVLCWAWRCSMLHLQVPLLLRRHRSYSATHSFNPVERHIWNSVKLEILRIFFWHIKRIFKKIVKFLKWEKWDIRTKKAWLKSADRPTDTTTYVRPQTSF